MAAGTKKYWPQNGRPGTLDPMKWEALFARRTRAARRSTVREFIKLTQQPGMISFAGGIPDADLFPLAEVRAALQRIEGKALQYGEAEGAPELREWIAEDFNKRCGLPIDRDDVLVTTGSQQGVDIVGRTLLNEGDLVGVENPTYLAALAAWRPLGACFASLECDEHGLSMESVERLRDSRPKLLYLMPDFQNPTGRTLSLERRKLLIHACERLPIVEDDPYGALRFEGESLPPLVEFCPERVIHLGSFSKTLLPGSRVGFMIAPEEFMEQAVRAKQPMDLHTSALSQFLILELLKGGVLDRHLPKLRAAYRARRDAMLDSLASEMPEGVRWTRPAGGFFVFLSLPEELKTADILRQALQERVAFVPGDEFFANGGGENTLRLNFTKSKPDEIKEGIRRLGRVIRRVAP